MILQKSLSRDRYCNDHKNGFRSLRSRLLKMREVQPREKFGGIVIDTAEACHLASASPPHDPSCIMTTVTYQYSITPRKENDVG